MLRVWKNLIQLLLIYFARKRRTNQEICGCSLSQYVPDVLDVIISCVKNEYSNLVGQKRTTLAFPSQGICTFQAIVLQPINLIYCIIALVSYKRVYLKVIESLVQSVTNTVLRKKCAQHGKKKAIYVRKSIEL